MQPGGRSPEAAELRPLIARLISQDPSLGFVENSGDLLGIFVDRIDNVFDDSPEESWNGLDLATLTQRVSGHVHGRDRIAAAADKKPISHGEMEEADLLGRISRISYSANEIGEGAVDTGVVDMELLVIAGRYQGFHGRGRQTGKGPQGSSGAGIRQIEVEPHVAVKMLGNRLIDCKLLGGAVLIEVKGPHQARQRLRARFGPCASHGGASGRDLRNHSFPPSLPGSPSPAPAAPRPERIDEQCGNHGVQDGTGPEPGAAGAHRADDQHEPANDVIEPEPVGGGEPARRVEMIAGEERTDAKPVSYT